MKTLLKTLILCAAWLTCGAAQASGSVPINATFGIQWNIVNWDDPSNRITESLGAAGLPNGQVIGLVSRDHLDALNGRITSDYVIIAFSDVDRVYAAYNDITATYDPQTNTASFFGPVRVVGGEGRFVGAYGTLSIRTKILFSLPVGTFSLKGVIRTVQ
jgi:hypothetical protein